MGFGLLFVGYIFTLDYSLQNISFDLLPDLIGYLIMFSAMCKLGAYNKGFKYAKTLLIPLIAIGSVTLVFETMSALGFELNSILDNVLIMTESLSNMMMCVYTVALMIGIRDIARETDLPKIAFRAIRNLAITVFYYIATVLTGFITENMAGGQTVILMTYLFGILTLILNLILIFSCYMRICLEGDEDMPAKPSRFAFINRMNERIDRAMDKMEKSGADVAIKKANKKNKKRKKKK